LRVADNGIAPAKCNCLRAKLRGRHQISDLAMASDHDWNTRKYGSGYQREIGVEIESVRDLDVMMAQMAA
jgi:hypothetical protein